MSHYEINQDFTIQKKDGGKKVVKNENSNLLLAKYANVGYYLIAPLLIGVFFGLSIDTYLNKKPFFTIICLIFGVIGVFYNLNKIIKDAAH